jgi:uncharacterized protein (DUF1800 family)
MNHNRVGSSARSLFVAAIAAATVGVGVAGCGGGGSSPPPAPAPAPAPPPAGLTANEAARFLTQSTFGPDETSIARVQAIGYSAWLDEQLALPATPHLPYVQANLNILLNQGNFQWMQDSFWQQAIPAPDQLRQRVKYALSQILVISAENGFIASTTDGLANYADLLGQHAFGNYRQLLEAVATSPMMGHYLSHLGNKKANAATGSVPDENFAREIMQLFTIGLLELNPDGTTRLVGGNPVETYTNVDVTGLARVFTGWSWAASGTSEAEFRGALVTDPQRAIKPMKQYPQHHESGAKTFLGSTIPAGTSGEQSLTIALDRLFNHSNLCPFIGRQLIQRLVTSNPSPAYVGRVAAACADNGAGVRGDMKAIVRAILLDADARDSAKLTDPQWGKLREPAVRLANWARCFRATSTSGNWMIRNLDNASAFSLTQQPWRAPSVFNFYRPGYVPPNTALAAAGLVAPEFQIVGETSVAKYTNTMQGAIQFGIGVASDVRADYAPELAVAADADALIDRVDRCLTYGTMGTTLRNDVRTAINAVPLTGNGAANRVYTAILLTMAAPEYLVQK